MEGIVVIIGLILVIFPIVIVVKLNSIKNDIKYLKERINEVPKSISKLSTTEVTVAPKNPEVVENKKIQENKVVEKTVYSPAAAQNDLIIAPPGITSPVIKNENIDERNVFEKLLGTNWLSKIGIVTLVLGIGFFVKYAIDQEWINEIGRVGIGILTGGIIIGIAHKLKSKYHVFSSILVGGGISVFYITITLAFREYELFGQSFAFGLLIAVTVFSVILSLLYDRKELAIFSLLGGFASPLMVSTGVGNYVVLFSYILILNTGMLIVSYLKKWRTIGIISYILTLVFFWTWTLNSYENQFFSVSLFISLFFIQFYLLALFDHFKSSERRISAYQAFLILTNNLSAFLAYLYVFGPYSYDIRGLITILFAIVNAVVLVMLFRNSRIIDRNMIYLIIAIVLSFVSLAAPIQLKGHAITLFWAAESVVLLWLWKKSLIKIFYTGFILISSLVLISYFMDILTLYSFDYTMTFLANRLFVTGVFVIAAFVVNRLLLKRELEETDDRKQIVRIFSLIIIILAYIVPFIELDMQLAHYVNVEHYYLTSSFRYVTLATFTTIYIAVLGFLYKKDISAKKYIFGLLYLAVLSYAIFYTLMVSGLRYDILKLSTHPVSYFSVHLLSLPAIGYIVYLVVKNIKSLPDEKNTWLSWLLTVSVVVILSVETDNMVIWLLGNPDNYYNVLHDVHTFGYPILWGIIAMTLMIWGLNRKEALLRHISLVFFGFIIVKFYAYDVWKMSQSGRIISFVLLGVILLLVSFLQQKIRTLVKDDNDTENNNNAISQ